MKFYPTKDLETLWGALKLCVGTEALAKQAVLENRRRTLPRGIDIPGSPPRYRLSGLRAARPGTRVSHPGQPPRVSVLLTSDAQPVLFVLQHGAHPRVIVITRSPPLYSYPPDTQPFYSFCNTLLASKGVLFEMMGKEEALEVMLKNPAVLQCGA